MKLNTLKRNLMIMTDSTHVNKYVTNTMGLVLRIEKRQMSDNAKKVFVDAETSNTVIFIPAIVLAEILYLSERNRITISLKDIADYMKLFPNYKEFPLSFEGIKKTMEITDIKELHDRLIAGAGLLLNVPVITNDPVIQASEFVNTLW